MDQKTKKMIINHIRMDLAGMSSAMLNASEDMADSAFQLLINENPAGASRKLKEVEKSIDEYREELRQTSRSILQFYQFIDHENKLRRKVGPRDAESSKQAHPSSWSIKYSEQDRFYEMD
jgi:hypothetical protein